MSETRETPKKAQRIRVKVKDIHFLAAQFPFLHDQTITITVLEDEDQQYQVVSFFLDPLLSFNCPTTTTNETQPISLSSPLQSHSSFTQSFQDKEVKVTFALNYGYARLLLQPPVPDVLEFLKKL